MKLFEFDSDDLQTAYYDPATDELQKRHLADTRKPVLTLRHLNRLKKVRALQNLESVKRQDLLAIMYGAPADDSGGMGMGMGGGMGGGF